MPQGAFFEQKRFSPTAIAAVVALHAGALGAMLLVKGPVFERLSNPTKVVFIPHPPDPPPEPERRPEARIPQQAPRSRIDTVRPLVEIPSRGPVIEGPPIPAPPLDRGPIGEAPVPQPRPQPQPLPPSPPVRVDAELDPRFVGDLQPAYPASEERAEREGSVRLRVTIGTDGRVRSVERLSATSEAFWRATERHALSRWRFRPATVDGRPVESSKVMTVIFQLSGR